MKQELFNQEVNRVWQSAASTSPTALLEIELEFYKKMLIFFQIGESCYLIFNYQTLELDFTSKEITDIFGYDPAEITTAFMMQKVHPDDRDWYLAVQDTSVKFLMGLTPSQQMRYKLRFDCRFRKKDGTYIRVIQQAVVMQTDEDGNILKTLIVFTDISHFKQGGRPILSFIGLDGEPSYQDVAVNKPATSKQDALTEQEKRILYLIMEGKTSKEIAAELSISKYTVDNHRKNMLHKNGLHSSSELTSKALQEGWL